MSDNMEDCGQSAQFEDIPNVSSENSVLDIPCVRVSLPENLLAYYKKETLIREVVLPECDVNLLESVMSNYIIAKKILKHLSWQDKLVCKLVCSTWKSAIQSLNKEQLEPQDFIFDTLESTEDGLKFIQSGTCKMEPLVAFVFVSTTGFACSAKCKTFSPTPCTPACEKQHSLIDLIYQTLIAPKNTIQIMKADCMAYVPLENSITYPLRVFRNVSDQPQSIISGLYIPAIPNVEYNAINLTLNSDIEKMFNSVVDEMSKTRIIKGIVVFVTEKYLLAHVETIVFLNHFKKVQPDIPYAFGGCIIEDVMSDNSDIAQLVDQINASYDYVTENLFSIGIFSVPKDDSLDTSNFDMYSVVLDLSFWSKIKIEEAINEFASSVPRFEHSVILMLSCVGRGNKHEKEQDYCRRAFPNSRIIGCYGNGELGTNHPPKKPSKTEDKRKPRASPQMGFMYSYSTVFVYMGWGKKYPPIDLLSKDTVKSKRLRKT